MLFSQKHIRFVISCFWWKMVIFKNYLILSDEIGFKNDQIFSKNIFKNSKQSQNQNKLGFQQETIWPQSGYNYK